MDEDALVQAFSASGGATEVRPTESLGASLAALHRRAVDKWPGVVLAPTVFAARLGKVAGQAGLAGLFEIETDDLFLAEACLAHDPTAVRALAGLLRGGAGKWSVGTGADPQDLVQRILDRLILPHADSAPRLATFEGRAPLVAYLKVVTRNAAISQARTTGREEVAAAPGAYLATLGNPEHDALRLELRDAFDGAIDEAFRALDDRSRAVVAMHYGDGVEVAAIAKVYRVNRVTVSRWLADARERILVETRRRVQRALRLTDSELDSALRVVRSQIDVRMSTLRAVARPTGT